MLTGSLDYGGQWVQINEMHFVLFSNLNGLKQAAVDSSRKILGKNLVEIQSTLYMKEACTLQDSKP